MRFPTYTGPDNTPSRVESFIFLLPYLLRLFLYFEQIFLVC